MAVEIDIEMSQGQISYKFPIHKALRVGLLNKIQSPAKYDPGN